jgi:hypothetical protein
VEAGRSRATHSIHFAKPCAPAACSHACNRKPSTGPVRAKKSLYILLEMGINTWPLHQLMCGVHNFFLLRSSSINTPQPNNHGGSIHMSTNQAKVAERRLCEFCGDAESVDHLFFDSPLARYNWIVICSSSGLVTKKKVCMIYARTRFPSFLHGIGLS